MRLAAVVASMCAAVSLCAASALAQDTTEAAADAPRYAIIKRDVSIPFANRTITGYRVGEDRSLIIDTIGRRFYRAELEPICSRDLRWNHVIGVRAGADGTLDRTDYGLIEGRRCYFYSFDQIADPRPPRREKAG